MKQNTPPALAFLDDALAEARRRDLYRERPPPRQAPPLSFCSNDYLALATRPAPADASGCAGSRLVTGDHPAHAALEAAAAALTGLPAALVFSSGYAANVGLLSALAGPEDLIISDALNHASIIDGARLSRARVIVVPHLDVAAVARVLRTDQARRSYVVTESYFSMDADTPDLAALRALCNRAGAALVVDEAHALGVLGSAGRGLSWDAGVVPDALVGTFGKAFGAAGAFVAGCPTLVDWLWNRSRPFVFSTGLSPALAAAALDGIERAAAEPNRRQEVARSAAYLRAGLARLGAVVGGHGPIVPWIVGEPGRALEVADHLRGAGFDVRAIRPP
ncbi:MAG: aminotransferase class I/II-fold pyridoxal phosphate-dependent enzyme, partial [Myxococcales bacterium]|nr:aminotransferase class I/II-fold pyridoxal phosphate-dependent enzyme [Myxococcales bacterium]